MSIDPFDIPTTPFIRLQLPLSGYILLGFLALATLGLLYKTRRDFKRIKSLPGAGLFVGSLLAAPPLARALLIPQAFGPSTALLAGLPLVTAATWLGPGPAILVGLVSGLARAGWESGRLTQPFEIALWAAALGLLLHQPYRDRIGGWLRQPVVASLLSALVIAWPLTLVAVATTGPPTALAGLEVSLAHFRPALVTLLTEALLAGLIVQIVLWRAPSLRPARDAALVSPPWAQHLSTRILFTLTPVIILAIVILVGGVALAAYPVASNLVIDQMAREAQTVSNEIPFFVQAGRGLIRDLARDERLLSENSSVRQTRLDEGLQSVTFFQQLIYLDTGGNPVNAYPELGELRDALSQEEDELVALALEGRIPVETSIYTSGEDSAVLMSFAAPIQDPASGEPVGFLLGRTSLNTNPLMAPVVDVLRGVPVESGDGFIVDANNTILLYPARPERQGETLELTAAREVQARAGTSRVLRETHPDGTQQLLYIRSITGHSDWSVVLSVPNQVVLALAAQIAWPTFVILLLMAALGLGAVVAISARIAEPLETMARAAGSIAAGQLDDPVDIEGEDEIGRLGRAFEDMRYGLKARSHEQETLLEVSYAVSASLDLLRSLPPILSSALEATEATAVRMALPGEDDTLQIYAAGERLAGMAPMDEELIEHADSQGALVVSRMERASETLKSSASAPRIQALIALPIRSENVFLGILWLAYEEEHEFEQPELTFLQNLASQASFAIANARLFQTAEGGRRQLSAILSSTTDAVLVIDDKGCLMLTNPAAEDLFGVNARQASGRQVEEVIEQPELVALLSDLKGDATSVELHHEDGKTLLANASPILNGEGDPLGRVALLSDITYLKELDQLKSAFVNAVSHDLRAPLTFMSGYITMLPMVGDLNEKQREFALKIKTGVDQMSDLIEKLLNLGRIESGVALNLEACDVKGLLDQCYELYTDQAREKKLKYELDLPNYLPHIPADTTLYRQAIVNLVENAVKYTPNRGHVTISASAGDDILTVAIKDTGPGISPEALEQLFQPFFRVKSRDTSTVKGSGLGLAIVKGMAERHGGAVRVESEPGEGSIFYLEMPLQGPEQPQ